MQHMHRGVLPSEDPLYHVLAHVALPELLGRPVERPIFDVYAVDGGDVIRRYVERGTGAELACKFYGARLSGGDGAPAPDRVGELLQREFANLRQVWALGLSAHPHRVVRPLAVRAELNYALVEEFISGPSFDTYLKCATIDGDRAPLHERVADLAAFLATLHERSQTGQRVDGGAGLAYNTKVIGQLAAAEVIAPDLRGRLDQARAGWAARGALGRARQVLVHGDVTPVNIVFGDDHAVIAIDLERLRADDPAVDLGMVVAELRHAFFRSANDPAAAEPFIERFFTCYADARQLAGVERAGLEVCCCFYAGTMLLRIGRNDWLDLEYRRALCTEAERWLAVPGQGLFSLISTTR